MADDTSILLSRIESHCEAAGIAPSTFGARYFRNSRLYSRLKNGGELRLSTYRKLTAILDAGPPAKAGAEPENAGAGAGQ